MPVPVLVSGSSKSALQLTVFFRFKKNSHCEDFQFLPVQIWNYPWKNIMQVEIQQSYNREDKIFGRKTNIKIQPWKYQESPWYNLLS